MPADGPDIYQHFVLATGLTQCRLVRAMEFRPGNARVVDHATIYLDKSGEGRKRDALDPSPGYSLFGSPGIPTSGTLGGWAPGGLPENMGRPIGKGADVVAQIHYHPVGKLMCDRSRVGLYFAPPTAGYWVMDALISITYCRCHGFST